ncbi:MAG: hypothetical protein LBG76_03260 [Treponema sp.]|jgi:hypothetical protein|nr:hypothetical protein [Treponema sp.]
MKKNCLIAAFSVVLAFGFLVVGCENPAGGEDPGIPGGGDNSGIYEKMIAKKAQYPEGKSWTNADSYKWKASNFTGHGCAAFAMILSDAAFGDAPHRQHTNFNNLRVGDILRMNGDTHSAIILAIDDSLITLAEGNWNSKIHWGRQIPVTYDQLDYVWTRYSD